MGREYAGQVAQEMGVYPDSAVQMYVSGLGRELAVTTERPRLPWTFTVMDDPTVNAFALPGGYIFVTRGILGHMNSEAELATVVGHEIGHVTARHSVQQMTPAADRPDRPGGRGDRLGEDRPEPGRYQSGSRRPVPQVWPRRRDSGRRPRLSLRPERWLRRAEDGGHVHDPAAGHRARRPAHSRVAVHPSGSGQSHRGDPRAPGQGHRVIRRQEGEPGTLPQDDRWDGVR